MTRRDWIAAVAFVLMIIGIAACGHTPATTSPSVSGASAITVPLPDSRSVICIIYDGYAISCDWEHAK